MLIVQGIYVLQILSTDIEHPLLVDIGKCVNNFQQPARVGTRVGHRSCARLDFKSQPYSPKYWTVSRFVQTHAVYLLLYLIRHIGQPQVFKVDRYIRSNYDIR